MTEPTDTSDTGSSRRLTEPGGPDDAVLDPSREATLRRVLADSAGPEPLPPHVATRLDGVLAGLVEERIPTVSHPEGHGVVVPLDAAARRRRLRVRVLLGAAAAVVAIGVGVGAINVVTPQGSDDVSAANEMAEEDPARSDEGGAVADSDAKTERQDAGEAPPEAAAPTDTTDELTSGLRVPPRRIVSEGPLREVRADRLREDLVALQHVTLPRAAEADYAEPTLTAPADFMCEPAAFGHGYLVGVEYAGQSAVVAFREPVGSTQAAEVLACGTGDVLHSTTLATTE